MTEPLAVRCNEKHLSNVDITKILALDKASTFQWEIASLVKCSWTGIQRVLATYDFETFQRCNPWREYQRKITQHENQYIERALKQNNSLLLRDITNIISDKLLPISETTLRCQRSESELVSYVAAEKRGLRFENIAKRLKWTRKYKD